VVWGVSQNFRGFTGIKLFVIHHRCQSGDSGYGSNKGGYRGNKVVMFVIIEAKVVMRVVCCILMQYGADRASRTELDVERLSDCHKLCKALR